MSYPALSEILAMTGRPTESIAVREGAIAWVEPKLARLAQLNLGDLRAAWLDIYGIEAPTRLGTEFVKRAVAHHLQEQAFGGLSKQARFRLKALEGRSPGHKSASGNPVPPATVKIGTRFVREWQRETHEVLAIEDGSFVYRGKTYRSLTVIARDITGTHQSGPRFFGLGKHGCRSQKQERSDV
jgi:hypothetical protein